MSVLNYKLDLLTNARDAIRQALADKGQVVGNDMRTYAQAIRNITGGQIRLFSTKQEMEESTGNIEGILGVIYNKNTSFIEPNSTFNTLYFPETITLDNTYQVQGYNNIRISISPLMFECMISDNQIEFDIMHDESMIQLQIIYTSQDGQNYTMEYNPFVDTWQLDEVGWSYSDGVLDMNRSYVASNYELPQDTSVLSILQQVVLTYNRDLTGFYEYRTDVSTEHLYAVKNISKIPPETGEMIREVGYESEVLYLPKFVDAIEDMLTVRNIDGIQAEMFYNPMTNTILLDDPNEGNQIFDSYEQDTWNRLFTTTDTQSGDIDCIFYEIDPIDGIYVDSRVASTELYSTYTRQQSGVSSTMYVHKLQNFPTNLYHLGFLSYYKTETSTMTISNIWTSTIQVVINPEDTSSSIRAPYTVEAGTEDTISFVTRLGWYLAKTSLTLEKPNQLLPGIKGFGSKGLVVGNSDIYKNIDTIDFMKYNGLEALKDYTVSITKNAGGYINNVQKLTDCTMDVIQSKIKFPNGVTNWYKVGNYVVAIKYSEYTIYLYDLDGQLLNTFDELDNLDVVYMAYVDIDGDGNCQIFQPYLTNNSYMVATISATSKSYKTYDGKLAVNSLTYFIDRWVVVATDTSSSISPSKMKILTVDKTSVVELKTTGAEYTNRTIAGGYFYIYYYPNSMAVYLTMPKVTTVNNETVYTSDLYKVYSQAGSGLTATKVTSYSSKAVLTKNGYMLYNSNIYKFPSDINTLPPELLSGHSFTQTLSSDRYGLYICTYFENSKLFMYYMSNSSVPTITLSNLNGLNVGVNLSEVNLLYREQGDVYNPRYFVDFIDDNKATILADVYVYGDNDTGTILGIVNAVVYFDRGVSQTGIKIQPLYCKGDRKIYMYVRKYGILNDPNIEFTGDILGN